MPKKLTYKFVKSQFENEHYDLLSNSYIDSKHKIRYRCPKGHEHDITYANWHTGHRCPTCASINGGKLRGFDIDFVRKKFEEKGYKLISTVYEGPHKKLKYICPHSHLCNTTWAKWYYANQKCVYCSKRPPINFSDIKKSFEDEGHILLSDKYINGKKLNYICPNGHKGSMTWDNWKYNKRRCKKCSNNVSKFELEIKKFLYYIGIEYVANDQKQIVNPNTGCNLELDIWLPNFKKAIECNGKYWHSKQDRIKLDNLKMALCKNKNIDLLIITDEEWRKDIDKSKQKIISFLEDKNVKSYFSV